jgi:predicted lipoprotein with Yx(FWY)xxD motif
MSKYNFTWRPFVAAAGFAPLFGCVSENTRSGTAYVAPAKSSSKQTNPVLSDMETSIGTVRTTSGGRTVYTYDDDNYGSSNCYGACAKAWPPYLGDAASEPFGNMRLLSRSDGTMQWMENGKPLYTYAADTVPGDVGGQNYKNVWHVVR